ncbi:RNA-binding protein 1 isoform X1 [Capsicum chacoense]
MADAYWRYSTSSQQAAAAAAAALPQNILAKRPRTEYGAPSGPEYPGYYGRVDERGMPGVISDADPLEASYERYLHSGQIPSHVAGESARSMNNGISIHPIEAPRVMGIGGSDPLAFKGRNVGMPGSRPEVTLPPDASSTLFVEGLPADCTRREVSHIFRPFVGYKEVRLVQKGSKHAGGDPLILCFVDFASPLHSAAAMDALQGYKFDEHDRDSVSLRLQFARNPGARSGGGNRRKR